MLLVVVHYQQAVKPVQLQHNIGMLLLACQKVVRRLHAKLRVSLQADVQEMDEYLKKMGVQDQTARRYCHWLIDCAI